MIYRLSAVFCVEKMADCVFGAGAAKRRRKSWRIHRKTKFIFPKNGSSFL